MPTESALVVLAPQAEPLVRANRDQFDSSAAVGVPAHLTVLYPFIPPPALDPTVNAQLAALFAGQAPFDYALTELRRFPGVLYLAPEPDAPFRTLTQSVAEAFPGYPPYGGKYADVVPHLTLADLPDAQRLDQIAADFSALSAPRLPLRLRAEAVVLMDDDAGAWRVRETFRLGR
jgi:2'-5' RNA ligase